MKRQEHAEPSSGLGREEKHHNTRSRLTTASESRVEPNRAELSRAAEQPSATGAGRAGLAAAAAPLRTGRVFRCTCPRWKRTLEEAAAACECALFRSWSGRAARLRESTYVSAHPAAAGALLRCFWKCVFAGEIYASAPSLPPHHLPWGADDRFAAPVRFPALCVPPVSAFQVLLRT